MDERDQRVAEVQAKLRAARPAGDVSEHRLYSATIDPEYNDVYNSLYLAVMGGDNKLPLKFKEILVTCLLAARGYGERVTVHIERAMNAGATEPELHEAFEVAALLSGVPTMLIGIDSLATVAARRRGA